MQRLAGKVVAIAGGASGIGAGVARRVAQEGAKVMIGDLDSPRASELADEINREGGDALAADLDIDDDGSVTAFVRATVDRFGGLDTFLANAANFAHGAADTDPVDIKLDVYDDIMRTNARGHLLCTRHAIPELLRRGGGAMLYTSSGAAHVPDRVRVAYSMSKSAVHALMRHVAFRWGPDNIRSNVIAPGVTMTPKLEEQFGANSEMRKLWLQRAVLPRVGEISDVASLVAHLASDDGSYISGQVISVDGGRSMRL